MGHAGTFGAATLYAIARTPARVDDDATGRKWNVTVSYSNNTQNFSRDENGSPVTDPTDAVKTVDIQYLEYSEPINNASLTITETDSTGTVATYTFPAQTLRMKPITKQPVWIDSELFFRITFPMEHKADTWTHSEADRSQSEKIYVGQRRLDGTAWTQPEIDGLFPNSTGTPPSSTILTITELNEDQVPIAVGDSRRLNGNGGRMGVVNPTDGSTPTKPCFVNWKIYGEENFSALNL